MSVFSDIVELDRLAGVDVAVWMAGWPELSARYKDCYCPVPVDALRATWHVRTPHARLFGADGAGHGALRFHSLDEAVDFAAALQYALTLRTH